MKDTIHDPKKINFEITTGDFEGPDEKKEKKIFYLLLDEIEGEELPIKIGDGTFGSVFKVEDSGGIAYALKILHDRDFKNHDPLGSITITKAEFEIARQRFIIEAETLYRIRQVIRERGIGFRISAIVDHYGYTENFPSEKLTDLFKKQNIKPSKYALIADLYDGTLKDLLETPIFDKEVSGYEILKKLDFKTRIRTILPFLRNVANGLSIMHGANYAHLDLKPANIFWRIKDKTEIESAIGDLGYTKDYEKDEPVTSPSQAALGTLHYRSPEQKDFQDTCEVEILPCKDSDNITLLSADPKFRKTIIEAGDNLKFLKDITRDFRVKHVSLPREDGKIEIIVESRDRENVEPDKHTQAIIYKNQGIRTDLFGFGAIVYDLITCGESPERFYSYLAADDEATKEKSVSTIIAKYQQVGTYSTQDAKYSSVFQAFFDSSQESQRYAPVEIVRLILKCMLYRAPGTYYYEGEDKGKKAFDLIAEEIQNLDRKYHGLTTIRDNPLFTGDTDDANGRDDTPETLKELIENIKNIPVITESRFTLLTRICIATLAFSQLIRFIKHQIPDRFIKPDYSKTDYTLGKFPFSEIIPENISITNNGFEYKINIYEKPALSR